MKSMIKYEIDGIVPSVKEVLKALKHPKPVERASALGFCDLLLQMYLDGNNNVLDNKYWTVLKAVQKLKLTETSHGCLGVIQDILWYLEYIKAPLSKD